jgi:hypothetical protein
MGPGGIGMIPMSGMRASAGMLMFVEYDRV